MELKKRRIILGVTGSIAIHKSVDLASQLVKHGASVHVVMTENATRLVQPLQFQVISRNPVMLNLFNAESDWKPAHIDLADQADLLVIAPATANVIGKMANGIADDVLSTVAISVHCPVLIAPAMEDHMYQNPFVQANMTRLRDHDVEIVEPVIGDLASGRQGIGRLNTVEVILERITRRLSRKVDLIDKKVVVTAGPTREFLDPVRFISNRSSGKMGYAVAEAAYRRGAEVILISGPTAVPPSTGIDCRYVETAMEMHEAVLAVFDQADIVIMTAAVADYRPETVSSHKIKKKADQFTFPLVKNPDIALELGRRKSRQILVGFAAETDDNLSHARQKLADKNLDLIVANNILEKGAGFEGDTNVVTLLNRDGSHEQLPLLSKREIAEIIFDRAATK